MNEQATEIINEGLRGITDYAMPIVLVLSIMLIFGLRIVKFNRETMSKYITYSIIITVSFISLGVSLQILPTSISEPIISGISTIVLVLFLLQLLIQKILKK